MLMAVAGCESVAEDQPVRTVSSAAQPLAGLSDAALSRFQDGVREFSDVESVSKGLGPLFNASSCAQCHNTPAVGGAGLMRVTRAQCSDDGQSTLVHVFSTRPDLGAANVRSDCKTQLTIAERRTTTLFGAGLIEAIADKDIEALAANQPREIAGRPAYVTDLGRERVGHFGWKAQHATLETFAGQAYLNELGITSELFPEEVAPNGDRALLAAMDTTPDPEAAPDGLSKLADFMRLLAPPTRHEPTDVEADGGALFEQIGCQSCHYADYTSESQDQLLDGRRVAMYSDLLLHDVGTGDGMVQGDAAPDELRTAPLWGTRHSQVWLHDGRAPSLDAAIRQHAGQALQSEKAYEQLDPDARAAVIAFLNSL